MVKESRPSRQVKFSSTGIFQYSNNVEYEITRLISISKNTCMIEGSMSHFEKKEPIQNIKQQLINWGQEWLWNYLQIPKDISWINTAIIKVTMSIATDGSYKPFMSKNIGGAAWILEDNVTRQQICGFSRSTTCNENSYRAELMAIYGELSVTLAVTIQFDITTGSIMVYCDNTTAIDMTAISTQRVSMKTPHADIIRCIRIVTHKLPLNIKLQHVKAHQDEYILYKDLHLSAQLNIQCDKMSKLYVDYVYQNNIPSYNILPHEQAAIWVNQIKTIGNSGQAIRSHINRIMMR